MERSDSFNQTKLFQINKTKMDKYIGEPCYAEINIYNWKPEKHKKIFEVFKLQGEDHYIESRDATCWYIVPKEDGIYTQDFTKRLYNICNTFLHNINIAASYKIYFASSWEDIEDDVVRKKVKHLYK